MSALHAQQFPIDKYAGALHAIENGHERLLDGLVERRELRQSGDLRPECAVELKGDVRVLGRVLGCTIDVHLIEADLLRALAGDLLVADRLQAEIALCGRVHVVTIGNAVEHVGLEHGVVALTRDGNFIIGEYVRVVLQVMAEFRLGRILEPGLAGRQDLLEIQLLGRSGVIVTQRHVGGLARCDGEGESDDARAHVIETVGFRVEGGQGSGRQFAQPIVEYRALGDLGVMAGLGRRRNADHQACRGFGRGLLDLRRREIFQQQAQLQPAVDFTQTRDVGFAGTQVVRPELETEVGVDRRELAGQLEHREVAAQVLADLARNLRRMREEAVQRAVLIEPFGGGLRADAADAGYVVGRVADEREIVDDLLRENVELHLDADAIEPRVAHGIDELHLGSHELRHILVAGRDQHRETRLGAAQRERADHVIGLDARDAQQRQPHRRHRVEQRLHLCAQVVRHRRAVRLVLLEQFVAEGAPRRGEHHGDTLGRLLFDELVEHVEHAEHRTGGVSLGIGQRRQRVKGAIQIRRAVDEDEFARAHGRRGRRAFNAQEPKPARRRQLGRSRPMRPSKPPGSA